MFQPHPSYKESEEHRVYGTPGEKYQASNLQSLCHNSFQEYIYIGLIVRHSENKGSLRYDR